MMEDPIRRIFMHYYNTYNKSLFIKKNIVSYLTLVDIEAWVLSMYIVVIKYFKI